VAAAEHAAELIESALVRVEDPAVAEMPFADQAGAIAGGFQVVRKRVFAGWPSETIRADGIFLGTSIQISLVAEAPRIATGEKPRAGRRTNGAGNVSMAAKSAAGRQAVDVRCLDGGAAGAAEIAVAHVVGEDDDDVRFFRGDVIAQLDDLVGAVIAKLEQLKLLENTLVIVSSDNGPVLFDGYEDGAVEKND
jgi:hypothetical protein